MNTTKKIFKVNILASLIFLGSLVFSASSFAKTFPMPVDGNVIGHISTAIVQLGENFPQIARDNDLGYFELLEANPGVNPNNPAPGTVLVIPSQYVLPNAPYRGIVVNLAEMRLYYFPSGGKEVRTFPIGIGREGEDTPIGVLSIIQKRKKPTWYVPESTRNARAAEGVVMPKSVPPGPDNPLGEYALRLSKPNYLIHGTNDPLGGIGRRSSAGCLRMYPEDIEPLYHAVNNGTSVYIIDEPYKAGISYGRLFLESHVPLQTSGDDSVHIRRVINTVLQDSEALVDWEKAFQISNEEQGIPQQVGELVG